MANQFCTACGAGVSEDKKFCTECGAPVQGTDAKEVSKPLEYAETAASSIPSVRIAAPPPVSQQAYQPLQQSDVKPVTEAGFIPSKESKYEPVSTRGYLGIWLLMLLPFINLILLIVWACGGCRKINKRNFARAMLITWGIALILGVILTFALKSTFNNYIAPMITPNLTSF